MYDSALFFITEAYSVVKVCVCVCVCVCVPLCLPYFRMSVLFFIPSQLLWDWITSPGGKPPRASTDCFAPSIFFFFVFFLGVFRSAWPPAASYTVVSYYLTVVDGSPVKKIFLITLKGALRSLGEEIHTLFNIYSINEVLMQTLKCLFFPQMNKQAGLRGK